MHDRDWAAWYVNHPHAWIEDFAETWRVIGWYALADSLR
jgi:hypothetical protein